MAPLQGPPRTPIRCAIYTRQSVVAQDDLSSCQVQFDLCSAIVRSQQGLGHELIDDRFDDEGFSGATLDRPALQRLLDLVRTGGVDRLIIQRLDRLSRNLRHAVSLFQEFRDNRVALTVVAAPELGVAALDGLMLNVLASFAQFEREMTASRIAEARAHQKAHGRRIAGAVPFGYCADPRTKQLVVMPEEAEIVSKMFRWAAAEISPSTITSYANALGWRTKSGIRWTARQVTFTLNNHVYAGLIIDDGRFREGCHDAVVEPALYHEVQNILAQRRSRVPGRGRRHLPWILRGLVRCGACDRIMSTHTVHHGSRIYCYYRCRSTAGGREPCKNALVSAGEIEGAVLSALAVEEHLVSKEQQEAVRAAIRQVVYHASTQKIEIEFQTNTPRR